MKLTHELGKLTAKDIGKTIRVAGWVNKKRNLGDLIFIDLRDRTGISQIVVTRDEQYYEVINGVKNEYVLLVEGVVKERQNINEKIPTGMIEIEAKKVEIINESKTTPMIIDNETDALEDTRLDYRYLDIRRPNVYQKLKIRHDITTSIRNFLNEKGFLDIETPILTKSTPEGARDYLVPSRVNANTCYALPQSPQIYKNLLMIGGVQKYYQIAKCFRDEDLRADRQPEFTQIDIEMAFMSQEEIRDLTEEMIKKVLLDTINETQGDKFPIIEYDQAMNDYGSDKPDIRFDLKLQDVTNLFSDSEFKVFKEAEMVKMIVVKNEADNFSRKNIDQLELIVKKNHAKGLAWLKKDKGLTGPISKFLSEKEMVQLEEKFNLEQNDLLLFIADKSSIVHQALGALRTHLGKELNLYDPNELAFVWITNWPMFEKNEEERLVAVHHPFTMPQNEQFSSNPLETRAQAYDIVLNGYELGGGSIRINDNKIQQEMFNHLGMSFEEIERDFGFLIEAYQYGAPYHGGIALGLDRFAMLLTGSESIRDVIAFPKNAKARETMINSPSEVEVEQLEGLNLSWNKDLKD